MSPARRPPTDERERSAYLNTLADRVASASLEGSIERQVEEYLDATRQDLEAAEINLVVAILRGRLSHFGPLAALYDEEDVRDIAVNAPNEVWAMRPGGWRREEGVSFASDEELVEFMHRLVREAGMNLSLTRTNPVVDARLRGDGPRICAVIPPATDGSPKLTIRKYRATRMALPDFAKAGSLSGEMASFLFAAVRGRLNIIISGGTGSGKTTLLSALLDLVPTSERLVIIEDTPEIALPAGRNIPRLISDRADGGKSADERLRTAMRMSPDRVIVGEVRGGEALTMLQAMNTGHEGSMSTIHANGTVYVPSRLETLALMSGVELPYAAVRGQIGAAIDLVVHIARSTATGLHYITEIAEITWDGSNAPTVVPVFTRDAGGVFRILGRPECLPRIEAHLPASFAKLFR